MKSISLNELIECLKEIQTIKEKIVQSYVQYELDKDICQLNNKEAPVLDISELSEELFNYVTRVIYELNVFKVQKLELLRPSIKNHLLDVFSNKCDLHENILNSSDLIKELYQTIKALSELDVDYIQLFLQCL